MRHPALTLSLLAFAGCQSSTPFEPALIADDSRPIAFHGRLSTSPTPLGPQQPETQARADDGRTLRVDATVLSVPRQRARQLIGVRLERFRGAIEPNPITRAHNAEPLADANPPRQLPAMPWADIAWPLHYWGPQAVRVRADEARRAFARLKEETREASAFEPRTLSFTCQSGHPAGVAVIERTAVVESFLLQTDDRGPIWEPVIDTAESGAAIELQSELLADGVATDFSLRLRDIVDVPLATSVVANSFAVAGAAKTTPVTMQAPLYSDQVFEGQLEFRDGDAHVLFSTNTNTADEILMVLLDVRVASAPVVDDED